MTWRELNQRTQGGAADAAGVYAWADLEDEGGLDDEIWECDTLQVVIEALKEGDEADHELAAELEEVR